MVLIMLSSRQMGTDRATGPAEAIYRPLLQAMAWAAFNGAGLALMLPCAQSVLADYYIPEQRGRAFGFMFTLAALGEAPSRVEFYLSTLTPTEQQSPLIR